MNKFVREETLRGCKAGDVTIFLRFTLIFLDGSKEEHQRLYEL